MGVAMPTTAIIQATLRNRRKRSATGASSNGTPRQNRRGRNTANHVRTAAQNGRGLYS
jgi:hypothetical protein